MYMLNFNTHSCPNTCGLTVYGRYGADGKPRRGDNIRQLSW